MMWSLCHALICLAHLIDLTFAQVSSLDALRRSLNVDPVSSHMRDRIISQNVNIPVSDVQEVVFNVQGLLPRPNGITAPQKAKSMIQTQWVDISQPSVAGKPVLQEQRTIDQLFQIQVVEKPALQPFQQSTMQPVPQRVQQPFPQPAPQRAITMSDVIRQSLINNNSLLNNVGTIDTSLSAVRCTFQIPSFLLPGPDTTQPGSALRCPSFLLSGPSINSELINFLAEHWTGGKKDTAGQFNGARSHINQIEFEQKCLLPALRAHVMGGQACRTRELAVYLEWLLYLRERLFNI